MKTYSIELSTMETIQIQIALDARLRNLFIKMEETTEGNEIQWLDDEIEIITNLARKISKETRD